MTKSVSNPTPNVGDTITFTVTLTNAGPDAATGVQVTDLLPAGLTFVSATPSQGSYVGASGAWTVGTIAVGASPTLQLTATVTSSGTRTNTATVSAGDQFDPNAANNTASTTVSTVTVTPTTTTTTTTTTTSTTSAAGGALPSTGAAGTNIALIGLGVLLAGMLLNAATVLSGRRRKQQT